jgi:hypothetical protein
MSKLIDLTGRKFGRLTVKCRSGTYQRHSGNKEPTWLCKCECGNEKVVSSSNLKGKNNTLSCGCLQAEKRLVARRETECDVRDDIVYVKTFEGEKFVVSVCDLDTVRLHRWRINASGYIADEHGKTIHRTLMSPPTVMDVHHINGNKLDNRRSNLLMMTRSEHTSLHNGGTLSNGVTVRERGRWIQRGKLDEDGNGQYYCSVCSAGETHNPIVDVPYCWKCGADMRTKGEDEEDG